MNKKIAFLLCLAIFFIGGTICAQTEQKPFKVVIDAGHGGHDPGCNGVHSKEKDVCLSTALKLGKLITDNCPNVKVIYTRKTDVFIELYRRAQIANTNKADVFISIHCNAAENTSAGGTETWVMGLHKSESNQAVARAENSAILKEKNYENNYEGYNPNSPEANIIFALYSNAYLTNSILLANKVQKSLVNTNHFTNRGVKQAGFWVLHKVAMPSILIELGFLTNAENEKYLTSDANLNKMATAIYKGFVDYYNTVTNHNLETSPSTPLPATEAKEETADKTNTEEKENKITPQPSPLVSTKEFKNDVHFKVQFLSSPKKIALTDKQFNNIPDLNCYYENSLWKYTAGDEPTQADAANILKELKSRYNDAFIIAFQGDKKITVSEANALLKK
ncbi:MAG: N-acetylmuramoyl-L-alanine amidase [Bacteroidales bacterium]|nr:N-acetylmuramoyl-L-alanine amidase [Bacteroidales bacterium]